MKIIIALVLVFLIISLAGWYMEGKKYNKRATLKQIYNKTDKDKKKIINGMAILAILSLIALFL